jgi:hypothetical protein
VTDLNCNLHGAALLVDGLEVRTIFEMAGPTYPGVGGLLVCEAETLALYLLSRERRRQMGE